MSARDLVGRPLVPFFDADDNVNESLRLDTQAHEQLDVDARVWDKDLGYFVYPTNAPQATHSMPIPIKKETPVAANDGASGSFGKMLLTPDMLFSRSAPSGSGSGMQQLHNTMGMTHAVPVLADTPGETTSRSASAKRGSRQKNRSSTPTRNGRTKQRNGNNNANNTNNANGTPTKRQQQQPQHTSDGGSSGGEDRTASDSSDKASRPAKNNNRKTRSKQQPQTPQKNADDLSSNGKWAWSAFQSSPDPRSLPLPPFVGGGGPSASGVAPPLEPPTVEERLDPPPTAAMVAGRPPAVAAEAVPLPPPHPTSVEHSMTQDLRRMLNIGS